MANFISCNRVLTLVIALCLLSGEILAGAQADRTISGADQIRMLVISLSNRSESPADALDPTISASDRSKDLGHFSTSRYELNIVPKGAPEVSGDTASMPIHVNYKAEDGNSLDANGTAYFVDRNGHWYFVNYDFMNWPIILIIVLVICLSIGVGYAATVLVLRARLAKQGPLGIDVVKIFIPFCWPVLFRKSAG